VNRTVDAINALSIFGPRQFGSYREHAAEIRDALGPDIETKVQAYVSQWASGGADGALVLTGNAGTGKTALVGTYCEAIGVPTPTEDGVQEVAEGRYILKDLSGVPAAERADVLRLETDIRAGERSGQLFLCANEGVLRDALTVSPDAVFEKRLNDALETGAAVRAPRSREPTILNLNRQRWTGTELWNRVLDYLVREALWDGCEDCSAEEVCPIRVNAEALRRDAPREAVRRLVQLGSGGSVATLRELLAILAHAITAGLTCSDIAGAADESVFTARTGYFNSLFGSNLDPERIERSQLLQSIRESRVGATADVEVDGWLRDPEGAPQEVRELASPAEPTPHATVETEDFGRVTFGKFGETITVSDDDLEVQGYLKDFVGGGNVMGLWRRRVFLEVQSFIGGRTGAFKRMTVFSYFGELLDLADSIARGADTSEKRQKLVVGLNYLAAGFHAFGGHLVVPDPGSLAARSPGSFRPPAPSLVHSQLPVDALSLHLEDGEELRSAVDTDNVRVLLEAQSPAGTTARLVLSPRLFQAIQDSGEFRAPVGSDIPEMTELTSFYAILASDPVEPGLSIVDPAFEVIRPVTLPSFDR
jgi:hypothetical protein